MTKQDDTTRCPGEASSRSSLPGISKKFNANEAQTLWKAIVEKERTHLEKLRTPISGMCIEPLQRAQLGHAEDLDVVKYASYTAMVPARSVVVPKHVDQTKLKRLKFIRPSKYDGFTEEEANARREKDDFEETYRFFSRPYNVTEHKCEHFNGYRMNNLFNLRNKPDPILPTSKELHAQKAGFVQKMARELSYDNILRRAVEAYDSGRQRAVATGTQAQFSGYAWPRYKYFSGGNNYGNTGLASRFPIVSSSEASIPDSQKKFKRKIPVDDDTTSCPTVPSIFHPSQIFKAYL